MVLFNFNDVFLILVVACVHSLLACTSHCDFPMCCHAWESFFISSIDCNQCIFVTSQLVADNAFLVHNRLFHYFISGVLIMMFFLWHVLWGFYLPCTCCEWVPILAFFIHGFSFTYQHQTDIKKPWHQTNNGHYLVQSLWPANQK